MTVRQKLSSLADLATGRVTAAPVHYRITKCSVANQRQRIEATTEIDYEHDYAYDRVENVRWDTETWVDLDGLTHQRDVRITEVSHEPRLVSRTVYRPSSSEVVRVDLLRNGTPFLQGIEINVANGTTIYHVNYRAPFLPGGKWVEMLNTKGEVVDADMPLRARALPRTPYWQAILAGICAIVASTVLNSWPIEWRLGLGVIGATTVAYEMYVLRRLARDWRLRRNEFKAHHKARREARRRALEHFTVVN